MPRITLKAMNITLTTDETGVAHLALQIPGILTTADGLSTPDSSGRYFKELTVWTEGGSNGDLLNNLRVEDASQVVPPFLGLTAQLVQAIKFPSYPVLTYMQDQDIIEDNSIKKGILIPPNDPITIKPIDQLDQFKGIVFIPSQVWLMADFISASGLAGKKCFVNITYGKYE